MYWLDLVLLIAFGLGIFFGARSGFVWQVAKVVIFFVAIYACLNYHEVARGWLENFITGMTPVVSGLLSYVVTFLAIYVVGYLITYLIERAVRAANLKPLDRLLGAGVGLLKAGLLSGAILLGLALYSTPQTTEMLGESKIAPVLLEGMRGVIVLVPGEYREKLDRKLKELRGDSRPTTEKPGKAKPEEIDPYKTSLD